IENLLKREARRSDAFTHPRNLDHDLGSRPIAPEQAVRPASEPPLLSPREASLAPFAQHFKSAKQAADQAAAEKLLDDLARLVDRSATATASASFASRLLNKIKPTR